MTRVTAPFGRRPAALTAREEHGAYVVIRCRDAEGPAPAPGQFYMLSSAERWGGGDGERPFLPRAFSVMRARPRTDGVDLDFLIEDVGPGTNRLAELDAGEDVLLVGPLGNGFAPPREGRTALLAGGGVGIAPLAIWQDELGAGGTESTILLGFRDRSHAQGADLLHNAAVATDDGSVGHHGLVTELLEDELEDRSEEVEVYACGPPAMLEAVRAICAGRGVPAQLALESGMACGFGACFGCVVPTHDGYVRLCVDGPVLDAVKLADASSIGSSADAELPGTVAR
ncbi:MAG TPA: dihydroorotate dehydrogenase electron transfer subunit [Solirubrobacteraceae bacterium]